MQKYTIKTTADERADTIVYFPIRGNLGLINFPNFLRRYVATIPHSESDLPGVFPEPWHNDVLVQA